MNEDLPISVIICTYNRSKSLIDTLKSLNEQAGDINNEIIVVDNNSSDDTKEVVMTFKKRFNNRIRYVLERRPGLSFARNTGIKESTGEILAFTDDDVIVSPQWVTTIRDSFLNHDCVAMGGKILPIWEVDPPSWLTKSLWYQLALLDSGNDIKIISASEGAFYGANFVVKKKVFREGFSFNTNLGRCGKKLLSGEDSQLFFWLIKNGEKIIYQPQLFVWHKINKERIRLSYFIKWKFQSGQSSVYLSDLLKDVNCNKKKNSSSQNKLKKITSLLLEYISSIVFFDASKRFRIELEFVHIVGKSYAYLKSKF